MKRFLLIAAGTVGGLGAVLSITPPQLGSTDLGLDMGTLATPDVTAQTPAADVAPAQSAVKPSSTKPNAVKPNAVKPSASNPTATTPTKAATSTQTVAPSPAQTQATVAPTPVKTAATVPTVKSINGTLEAIALSTPFRGTGWQTKFVEAKIARDLECYDPQEHKFYDDEDEASV